MKWLLAVLAPLSCGRWPAVPMSPRRFAYHAGGLILDDGEQINVEVKIRLDPRQEF